MKINPANWTLGLARWLGARLMRFGFAGTEQSIKVGPYKTVDGKTVIVMETLGTCLCLTPAEASNLGFELMLKAGTAHLRSSDNLQHTTKASLVPEPSVN